MAKEPRCVKAARDIYKDRGEIKAVVYIPHNNRLRSLRCLDKSHPQQKPIVLIWQWLYDNVMQPERIGVCRVCMKLYVIEGKDE